ncbi:hypothetical protein D3C74_464240 [compost metagenome]
MPIKMCVLKIARFRLLKQDKSKSKWNMRGSAAVTCMLIIMVWAFKKARIIRSQDRKHR